MTLRATLLSLCLLTLTANPALGASPIFGAWQLDVENSDDASKLLHPKKGKKKKQSHNEGVPPGGDGKADPPANPFPTLATKTLRISRIGQQVEIAPDQGKPLRVVPDGHTEPVSLSDWGNKGSAPLRFGSWEGDTLVMETTLDGGTHVVQSYFVDDQGLLVQQTEVRGAPGEVTVLKRRFKANTKTVSAPAQQE